MNSNYKPSLELLAQYLAKKCTQEDMQRVESWLSEGAENGVYLDQLKSEWIYLDERPIQLNPERRAKVWNQIFERLAPKPKVFVFGPKRLWYSAVAVAVIAVLVGGISTFLLQRTSIRQHLQSQTTIVKTNPGQKSEVLLPDGSTVWLNAGSKIFYNNTFNQSERNITLEGEAFFDVQRNENIPFVVQTLNLDVVVKGTAFDVSAYPEDSHTEVSLLRGEVDVVTKKGGLVRKLIPNDLIRYDNKKATYAFHQNNNAIQYSSWKNEELIFENESLDLVVKKLERWYGVEMDWEVNKSAKRYTFIVKTESLREMLQLINVITPIDYSIDGKMVKIRQR